MRKLLWLGCLSYLVIGLAHVIGGAVLEQMMAKYGLSYRDSGQWIMNQFLGFLVGVLLAPTITSKVGKRGGVLIAIGLLTISEAAYSLLPPWGLMLAIAPFAGFGFGMTEAVVGAMVIDMATQNGKASAMSRVETFFGIGAFLMPTMAGLLIRHDIWQLSFPVLAAMSGIMFILWLTMQFGGEIDDRISYHGRLGDQSPSPQGTAGMKQGLSEAGVRKGGLLGYHPQTLPFLLLGSLFFMVYVGMEMSFSNYLPSILIEQSNVAAANAPAALSLFWGTMIAGRLFAGRLADWAGYSRYLLFATAGAAVVFVGMALTGQLTTMIVLIGLSGLFFSGVFGIALVYANEQIQGMTERTTSLLVASGGLGGALFPRLTGWMMDRFGAGNTLWMLSASIILLFALLLVMLVLGRRHHAGARLSRG
ncbi:MFS transporter [Paenibacillus radicis (ex Gao et al. 2016)]|uniref:Glucose/mannose:H+ symporter GlcP n=1 Tax=Paenibacillus radicis (ex Gao et al. 2016) TaxID=1737354 RepID=A0A917HR94_9BACL|nr:MFS transporter [Paenibacillus radicis (ex Gao et al. 2016)]GGG86978.1 putative glucose/mannose:H+ symporter GlcP [Paenibacillus radicis (ex Gao et al. 2016)]